jgi:hypothetical protein
MTGRPNPPSLSASASATPWPRWQGGEVPNPWVPQIMFLQQLIGRRPGSHLRPDHRAPAQRGTRGGRGSPFNANGSTHRRCDPTPGSSVWFGAGRTTPSSRPQRRDLGLRVGSQFIANGSTHRTCRPTPGSSLRFGVGPTDPSRGRRYQRHSCTNSWPPATGGTCTAP